MVIKRSWDYLKNYWKRYEFLFTELIKRDFKRKYSRSALGILWSALNPLFTLLIMRIVFCHFFGRNTPHYTIFLFCGTLLFSFFSEATSEGITSLMGNGGLITKINMPKYVFLISKNTQTCINFLITLVVFFIFCIIDHVTFSWKMIFLIYPIFILVIINLGVGLILSTLYVFFRDVQYFWRIFLQLLNYLSAIFYHIDSFSPGVQKLFSLNPIYLCIYYFRSIVLDRCIPSVWTHLEMLVYAVLLFCLGILIFRKYKNQLVYYM